MQSLLDFIYANMETCITIITMLVVWVLGKLSKKSERIDNNLIIYQNIIVGILVSGLYFLITKDLSQAITLSGLFATTGYDLLHNLQKLMNKED